MADTITASTGGNTPRILATEASDEAQQARARHEQSERSLPVFFIIGIIINVVFLLAWGLWVAGQWKKNQRQKTEE